MKNILFRHYWIVFSTIILLLAAGWIWISKIPPDDTTRGIPSLPHQGFSAPDFELPTPYGELISLGDLHGQPVIINLWTSWCPPCRAEMPALENVYQAYQDSGLVVLGINATNQDDVEAATEFASNLGLTFPILLDTDGYVSNEYQLRSLPTTFFVDPEGIIQEVIVGGPMAEALLRVRVQQLLEAES